MKRLLAAMIEQARRDLDRSAREEVRRWIRGETLAPRLSFVVCCDGLGVDPDHVRDVLLRRTP